MDSTTVWTIASVAVSIIVASVYFLQAPKQPVVQDDSWMDQPHKSAKKQEPVRASSKTQRRKEQRRKKKLAAKAAAAAGATTTAAAGAGAGVNTPATTMPAQPESSATPANTGSTKKSKPAKKKAPAADAQTPAPTEATPKAAAQSVPVAVADAGATPTQSEDVDVASPAAASARKGKKGKGKKNKGKKGGKKADAAAAAAAAPPQTLTDEQLAERLAHMDDYTADKLLQAQQAEESWQVAGGDSLESLRQRLKATERDLADRERSVARLSSTVKSLKADAVEATSQLRALEKVSGEQIAKLTAEQTQLRESLASAKQNADPALVRSLQDQVAAAQEEAQRANLFMMQSNQMNEQLLHQVETQKHEIEAHSQMQMTLRRNVADLTAQLGEKAAGEESFSQQITHLNQRVADLQTTVDQKNEYIDSLETELNADDGEEAAARVAELEAALDDAKRSKALVERELNTVAEACEAAKRTNADQYTTIGNLQRELEAAKLSLAEAKEAAAKAKAPAPAPDAGDKSAAAVQELEASLEALRGENAANTKALSQKDEELAKSKEALSQALADVESMRETLKDAQAQQAAQAAQLEELREVVEGSGTAASQLTGDLENAHAKVASLTKKLASAEEKNSELADTLSAAQETLAEQATAISALEGEVASTKASAAAAAAALEEAKQLAATNASLYEESQVAREAAEAKVQLLSKMAETPAPTGEDPANLEKALHATRDALAELKANYDAALQEHQMVWEAERDMLQTQIAAATTAL